ncbi:hypothetical protein D3C73_1253280 [compost metagenome]
MRLGAEDDAVVAFGLLQHFITQGGAVFIQACETDIVVIEAQAQIEFCVGSLEHRHRRFNDFWTNTVTRKNQNTHRIPLTYCLS